jgi:hypothetical protein
LVFVGEEFNLNIIGVTSLRWSSAVVWWGRKPLPLIALLPDQRARSGGGRVDPSGIHFGGDSHSKPLSIGEESHLKRVELG